MGKEYSKQLSCGHCSNISVMEIIGSVKDTHRDIDPKYGPGPEYGKYYEVLKCPACKKANIISYGWHEDMESDEEITYKILYPSNNSIPLGLPENIRSAYEATEKIKSIDINAYVILSRRLLELICKDRHAVGNTLALMLQDLASKNEIPAKLVKVAEGLKNYGNIGAHAGIGELSEKEIPTVEALSRALLEYIYSAPYLASLAERKIDSIKHKAKGEKE